MGSVRTLFWGVGLLAVLMAGAAANASFLVNGDFEDLSDWGAVGAPVENAPAGWRDGAANRLNAAGQQAGANAIGGVGTSAYLPGDIGIPVAERKEIKGSVERRGRSIAWNSTLRQKIRGAQTIAACLCRLATGTTMHCEPRSASMATATFKVLTAAG